MSGSSEQNPAGSNQSSSSPVEDHPGLTGSSSPALHHGTTSAQDPVGTPPLIDPSAWSTMKDTVEELRKLVEVLHTISERPCNCLTGNISQSNPKSTDSREYYIPNLPLSEGTGEDLSSLPRETRSRLGITENSGRDKLRESLRYLLREGAGVLESRCPYVRIRKHRVQFFASQIGSFSAGRSSGKQVYDMVTGVSYDNCLSADLAWEWLKEHYEDMKSLSRVSMIDVRVHYICHVPKGVYENQAADSAGCFGKIWWKVDDWLRTDSHSIGTLDFPTVALLARTFFGLSKSAFAEFLVTFANLSHPIATRSTFNMLYNPEPEDEYTGEITMVLQHHLRHFKPVQLVENQATSDGFPDLVIERQIKKIPRITQGSPQSEKEDPNERNLFLQERALSASLVVFPCGTFRLFVLGDKGVYVESPRHLDWDRTLWDRIGIYPWDSGQGAGLSRFLVALFLLLEAWHRGWNEALDAINAVISSEMPYTPEPDQKRLADSKFQASSSMFHTQYGTVLDFLRLATQSIDDDMAAWEKNKASIIQMRRLSIVQSGDRRQSLEDQLDIVTGLWSSQTKRLKERVDRKIEDVKSMRDGLISATSLRVANISLEEAKKGTALNRAIYVFTVVTIIYTPLGFMAGFWALPILNTTSEGENIHPSRPAVMATFVIIPVLTYVACGWAAWYFKHKSWADFVATITMKQPPPTPLTRSARARRNDDPEVGGQGGEVAGSNG